MKSEHILNTHTNIYYIHIHVDKVDFKKFKYVQSLYL